MFNKKGNLILKIRESIQKKLIEKEELKMIEKKKYIKFKRMRKYTKECEMKEEKMTEYKSNRIEMIELFTEEMTRKMDTEIKEIKEK